VAPGSDTVSGSYSFASWVDTDAVAQHVDDLRVVVREERVAKNLTLGGHPAAHLGGSNGSPAVTPQAAEAKPSFAAGLLPADDITDPADKIRAVTRTIRHPVSGSTPGRATCSLATRPRRCTRAYSARSTRAATTAHRWP
jgi:hypothetical protein